MELTSSDYGFYKLSQEEFEEIISAYNDYTVQDIYPVAPLQTGFIYNALKNPEADHYFTQMSFDLVGDVDLNVYLQAWQRTVDELDILRTAFDWRHKEFAQIVVKSVELPVNKYDISDQLNEDEAFENIRTMEKTQKIDLSVPCQTRIAVVTKKCGQITILLSQHHIIMDGWSLPLLFEHVKQNYLELKDIGDNIHRDILQYGKYIKEIVGNNSYAKDIDYWKKEVETYDFSEISHPAHNEISNSFANYEKAESSIILKPELTCQIKDISKKIGVTTSDILLTAWIKLLSAYNNTDKIATGVTVSGREVAVDGIEDMIGLFINTLPLYEDLEGISIYEAICNTHKIVRDINEHSAIGLSDIQNITEEGVQLINSLYVFENYPDTEEDSQGYYIDNILSYEEVDYPMCMTVYEEEQITVSIECNKKLYETIRS